MGEVPSPPSQLIDSGARSVSLEVDTEGPEPDITLAFPEEVATLEQDLEGLEDWAADDLRTKGRRRLSMIKLYRRFEFTDDLGTAYMPNGSNHGGGNHEMTGEARFEPGVPQTASALTVSWIGLQVPIPIA